MKQPARWLLIVAAVGMAAFVLFGKSGKGTASVSVTEAHTMMQNDSAVVVLDVRMPAEFTGDLGHVQNSILLPVQELTQRMGELEKFKGKKILVMCRSGRRSGIAAAELNENGYNAFNIEGGMVAWNNARLPVAK
jgi:rhodanese-related sulfurtransferase